MAYYSTTEHAHEMNELFTSHAADNELEHAVYIPTNTTCEYIEGARPNNHVSDVTQPLNFD